MGTIPSFPTFVSGEIPTAAKLTQIKTAGDFWALTPRCSVNSATPQSIATGGTYVLFTNWDAETFDVVQSGDTEMHSTATFPERIYIRTTGKYQINGQFTFASNATGTRDVMLRANSGGSPSGGTAFFLTSQGALSGGIQTPIPIPPLIRPFNAGDYIEVFVRQSSGGALNSAIGAGFTFFQVKLDSA